MAEFEAPFRNRVPDASQTLPAAGTVQIAASSPPPPASNPEFFEQAITHAGVAIVSMNVEGVVTGWNPAATRLFCRSLQDAVGKPLELLAPVEYRPLVNRVLQRTLAQRSVNEYEMAFVPPGGTGLIHISVVVSCVMDKQDKIIGLVAWMRNISNRKVLESQLSQATHMASLGTLAAGVAHQFNNIVCGMSAMVDFALSTEDPRSMKRALNMAAEAASKISYITQSLMAFSAYDQNTADLADLTEVILLFADAIQPTLAKKGIELELDLQARHVTAVPRHLFGHVLQHLLSNAEQSITEMHKMVPGHEKKITIRSRTQVANGEGQIMIQFSDTGVGIPADHLPHVFDPFFTTKGVRCGGTGNNPGLGLTLVHGAVMDLGGHVWADSTPGNGATINILLPLIN